MRINTKIIFIFSIAIISILSLVGCAGGESTPTATVSPTANSSVTSSIPAANGTSTQTTQATTSPVNTPKKGGILYIGNNQKVTNLGDPRYLGMPADAFYQKPALETLIDSEGGNYVPRLAERWEIAPDGKSITFYLRKGVKFHDGTDFNADAVKYDIDQYRTGANTALKAITSVDVVDAYTVRFNVNQWDWVIMNSLVISSVGKIVSPTALKTYTKEQLYYMPVGTGPFKFKKYVTDTSITYERFDDYWQPGLPYLDGVEYRIYADSTTALMALKAGEIQWLTIQPQDVKDLKAAGFEIIDYVGDVAILNPDGKNPDSPFSNLKVRQAVSYAIDRELLAKSIGLGYYTPIDQPFDKDCWAYNPDIVGYPYNPDKARQLLAEAGYPNGFTTKINLTLSTDLHIAVQDMLAKVGINVEIQEVTSAKMSEMTAKGWNNGMLSLSIFRWGGHADPVQCLYANYMGGYAQVSVYVPDSLKEVYAQARSTTDLENRKALMKQITKDIVDTYCMSINIYVARNLVALDPKVHNPYLTTSLSGYIENVWLDK